MSTFIVPLSSLPTIEEMSKMTGASSKPQAGSTPFGVVLGDAIQNLEESTAVNKGNVYDLALGQTDDLHTGAIAAVKSQTAATFTANVVNATIGAYNELLRLQV